MARLKYRLAFSARKQGKCADEHLHAVWGISEMAREALEATKARADVFVIDKVSKPSEN